MLCRTQVLQSQIFHVFSFLYFFLSLCTCICADMALSVWVSSFSLLFIDVYRISVCMQVSFLCEKEYTKVDFSKCYVKCCSPGGQLCHWTPLQRRLRAQIYRSPNLFSPLFWITFFPQQFRPLDSFIEEWFVQQQNIKLFIVHVHYVLDERGL